MILPGDVVTILVGDYYGRQGLVVGTVGKDAYRVKVDPFGKTVVYNFVNLVRYL